MRYLLAALLSVCAIIAQAQQINPVPDYVFGNRMSVGRTSVTDTAAYFSIGPRFGAIRGFMPPMVVDTASVTGTKRNGLLIFSVQKNKFLYWDSVRVQWSDMAGSSGSYIVAGDTASMLLPYLRKADTTAMLSPYLKESDTVFLSNRVNLKVNIADTATMLAPYLKESDTAFLSNRINLKVNISDTSSMLTNYVRHAGYGLTKSGQAFLVDTAAMATRARVQKGIDSVATLAVGGVTSVATGYGLSGGTITSTGTISADTALLASRLRVGKVVDSLSSVKQNVLTNPVTGTGTTNYVPKFTGTSAVGNSIITESGTSIGINIASPTTYSGYGVVHAQGTDGGVLRLTSPSASVTWEMAASSSETYNKNVLNLPMWFGTNNINRLHIHANGNIGIGTATDAGYKTDIAGTLRSTLGANFATTSGNVGVGTTSPQFKTHIKQDKNVNGLVIEMANRNAADDYAQIGFSFDPFPTTITSAIRSVFENPFGSFNASLAFFTYSGSLAERGRFNPSGELLLNTTTDAGDYKLQVAGSIYNTTGAVLAASSGNVGIGTASPQAKLHIESAAGDVTIRGFTPIIELLDKSNNAVHYFEGSDAGVTIYADFNNVASSSTISFKVDNQSSALINASNELLVNTTSDAGDYKLQVNGNERIAGKLDVITTTEYGVNLGRSGTSATAFQAYNSTAAMAVGIESSTGGGLFTGTSAYAAVFGNANNYPTQFVTNNAVRATITASGNLLIGTATDNGLGYKLQVNGGIYANNTIQAKAAQVSIDSASNLAALYISQHSITGSSSQPMMQSDVTLNTTGDVNLVNYAITNTASGANTNWLRFSDGSNIFRVTKAAEVVTAAPTGGSIRKWKLGEAATVSPTSPNRTIRVEIDGTVYYLHAKTTND
jgi:hypothetical protein